jgi:hypothetical protein
MDRNDFSHVRNADDVRRIVEMNIVDKQNGVDMAPRSLFGEESTMPIIKISPLSFPVEMLAYLTDYIREQYTEDGIFIHLMCIMSSALDEDFVPFFSEIFIQKLNCQRLETCAKFAETHPELRVVHISNFNSVLQDEDEIYFREILSRVEEIELPQFGRVPDEEDAREKMDRFLLNNLVGARRLRKLVYGTNNVETYLTLLKLIPRTTIRELVLRMTNTIVTQETGPEFANLFQALQPQLSGLNVMTRSTFPWMYRLVHGTPDWMFVAPSTGFFTPPNIISDFTLHNTPRYKLAKLFIALVHTRNHRRGRSVWRTFPIELLREYLFPMLTNPA